MTLFAVVTMLAACGSTSSDEVPAARQDSDDSESVPDEQPETRIPTVDELAAMSPLDLMVDLSTEDWIASLNGGAGVEVTPDNWAEAYAIDQQTAAAEIAAAERDGLEAAATESWVSQQAPSTTDRLTIRRYASLLEVENPWWNDVVAANDTPDGLTVPQGMRLACAFAYDPETGAFRVDAGGYHADCVVTIGDTVIVHLSSTGPDDVTATAGAVGGISRWLEGVGAVTRRG